MSASFLWSMPSNHRDMQGGEAPPHDGWDLRTSPKFSQTTPDRVVPAAKPSPTMLLSNPSFDCGDEWSVSVPPDPPHRDEVSSDLVEYFVVLVESRDSLVKVVPALADLVESQSISILDVVVLASDAAGHVEAIEVDAIDNLVALHRIDGTFGGLLSRHDIELVSMALPPSSAAIVLVAEDRWAAPL